jgi:hypothetical protein
MKNIETGMAKDEAAIDAVSSTFNYGEVTRFTRMMRSSISPFFTWTSKIVTAMPEAMVRHPWRVGKYIAIPWGITQMALNHLNLTNNDWDQFQKDLPDYAKSGQYFLMPWKDDKGRLQLFNLTWWLPGLGDLSESATSVENPERWVQNPILNVFADIARNKKLLTGQEVYHEWEPAQMKISRTLDYIYQTFMPTLTPPLSAIPGVPGETYIPGARGGQDWNAIVNYAQGKQSAQTLGQIAGSQLGVKITPFDNSMDEYKKQQKYKMLEKDLKIQMNRELRDVTDEERKRGIVERYSGLMQRLQHLQMLGK